jgi:hypothetical protein
MNPIGIKLNITEQTNIPGHIIERRLSHKKTLMEGLLIEKQNR